MVKGGFGWLEVDSEGQKWIRMNKVDLDGSRWNRMAKGGFGWSKVDLDGQKWIRMNKVDLDG